MLTFDILKRRALDAYDVSRVEAVVGVDVMAVGQWWGVGRHAWARPYDTVPTYDTYRIRKMTQHDKLCERFNFMYGTFNIKLFIYLSN